MIKRTVFVTFTLVLALFLPQLNAQSPAFATDSSETLFVSGPGHHTLSFKPAHLPDSMTYKEFLKLQRNLSWQRIIGAAIVPGYVHFYAGHPKLAWTIAGIRTVGGVLASYAVIDQARHTNNFTLNFFGVTDSLSSLKSRSERNLVLFVSGLALNFLGYAFDWGHGDFVIDRERNAVLYKYGSGKSPKPLGGLWMDGQRKILGATLRIPM